MIINQEEQLPTIIDIFLKTAFDNLDKNIIISKHIKKTYKEFLHDIQKVLNYFENNNIKKDSKVLLFINMSYYMYVAMFASIMYGLKTVVIDNFKDIKRVNNQINSVSIDYVLTINKTNILKNIFKSLKNKKKVNIQKILKNKPYNITFQNSINIDLKQNILITYTSGSTSIPKPVYRTLNDLTKQMNLTLDTFKFEVNNSIVLATLPIYALICIVKGYTIYIPSKNEKLDNVINKIKPTILFSSISKLLTLKHNATSIKYLYFGGSILYYQEANHIKNIFRNAIVTYIYGATEASIISTISLDMYINSLKEDLLCLGTINKNNQIEIIDNEIVVVSKNLTNNYVHEKKSTKHFTKDLGYILDNKIYITGRKINQEIISNYVLEMILKKDILNFFNIACLNIKNTNYIFVEKKDKKYIKQFKNIINKYNLDAKIKIVKKLPLDYRHKSKVDYKKLLSEVKLNV